MMMQIENFIYSLIAFGGAIPARFDMAGKDPKSLSFRLPQFVY